MSAQTPIADPPRRGPRILRPFVSRPRLTGAFALGLLVGLALSLYPNDLRWSTRFVFAWDAMVGCFIGLAVPMMLECGEAGMRARAARQDEGQHAVLALAVLATAASVLAIAVELSIAKSDHGLWKGLRVALAFATVAASWLFAHLIFALHYAHEYYSEERDGRLRAGLRFPGGEDPDYWDFLHFAVIIGVASQTADIEFTSKSQRRIGTVHGVVAFVFNTVVLALTINLLAGLF